MAYLDSINLMNQQLDTMMSQNPWLIYLLLIAIVWKLIWYGIAIYNTIERKQKNWFVTLFVCAIVLNDLGLLAILYLVLNKKKNANILEPKKKKK